VNPVLDLTFIRQMMGNDEKVVYKFLSIFKEQCPRQMQELKMHYAARSWQDLSNVAHSLKTQFKYLSIESLGAKAYEIETSAEEEPATTDHIEKLGELIQSFEQELTGLLKDIQLPS
jgi:HPt (histidine-containing phosphotransfer) domain-containing protein